MALVQSQQITGSGLGAECVQAAVAFGCPSAPQSLIPNPYSLFLFPAVFQPRSLRYTHPVRVFGIDCGTEVTGFGVVETCDSDRMPRLACIAMGAIRLKRNRPLAERLGQVFNELTAEMIRWQPDAVAIEDVFYSINAKSALKLGEVRGVALLAAANQGLKVAEYAPLSVKSSVVGYGLAKKEQVQFMVARLLELAEPPQPADAADALAIAICHIHHAQTLALQGVGR